MFEKVADILMTIFVVAGVAKVGEIAIYVYRKTN